MICSTLNASNLTFYEGYNDSWEEIRSSAISLLPGEPESAYRLSDRLPVIAELVERLQSDTPPNEIGCWPDSQPASFEDIINAAWIFKIWKMGGDSFNQEADDLDTLHQPLRAGRNREGDGKDNGKDNGP